MKKALYLTMIIGSLFSCSRPKPIYYHVSNDIKAGFNFKPGTYWIMKDSISGRIDSFFVTDNKDEFEQTVTGGNYTAAQYSENIRITISDYNTYPSPASVAQAYAYHFVGSEAILEYEPYPNDNNGKITYWPFFYYPKRDSFFLDKKYDTTHAAEINGVMTACQVNSNSFAKVAIIHQYGLYLKHDSSSVAQRYEYNDLFYVCPKIGIVKMRLRHPQDSLEQVWEIQRWNIQM